MAKKKPIVSPLGQWAYPGEVTIIPSNSITMKGVNYPVLGIDNLGNQKVMMPGVDYTFPGDYVTEIPQMGKGGLTQWFAEKWTDIKTGKPCGRSGKEKGSRPYPACRPKNRVNETTPKTTSEMSSAEKARFKREKTSGKRIDYNHKRRQDGGENWLNQYQDGGLYAVGPYDEMFAPKQGNYLLPDINRPSYIDEFGGRRSEYKMGVNIDGKEILIPTVVGGRQLSEDQAVDHYRQTGLHMGQFNTPEEAEYASRLRTARYNMLEDPIRFQADQFQRGGMLPPIYTSNPRDPRIRRYNDSLNLYNKEKRIYENETGLSYNRLLAYSPSNSGSPRYGYTFSGKPLYGYKKPVQPYIYKKPEPVTPPVESVTPLVESIIPLVEPPKPSLVISNIDRDMYTPGGGMAREYNIGVTLQDGSKKSFRTEKEYQDWKAANNLDISNAKVTEGRGYSYNYPENKKYGGWLERFDEGGAKSFWDKYKYLPSSDSSNTYEKVNIDKNRYQFNSPLGNKGTLKVQQYQKWLNENFNTYLDEDGIWGKNTENAYKKYVLEKQKPTIPNINSKLLNNYDSKLSFRYDDKGKLQVKSGDKYEEDYQDWTNVEKLSPTLNEFKNLVDKIPSYNQYYEDIYDADPNLRGKQAGPVIENRALEIENTKKYKPISDKYKEYIGKTFGTLPIVEGSGIYEGYSPNRIWTTPPGTNSKPWLGDNETYNPEKNPRYLYFITPKEGTKSADKKFIEKLEDLNCASGNCGDEYLNKNKNSYFETGSSDRFKKALKVKETIPGPTGETWKLGQQAYIEMLNNPDIINYAKEKNIDLTNLSSKEAYSPLLAEALVASRDARFNNKDVVIPDSRYYSTVIQNPDVFNLEGYLPITLDMFSPNTDTQSEQKLLLNWDKASREDYLQKAGIPKDKWDDVYIHTSSFPIEKYTPGKKYGGWLDQYQNADEVPSNIERMSPINIRTHRSLWDKLKGYIHRGERAIGLDPYNERSDDFMEQWARRVNEATGGKDWYKQPNDASGAGGIGTAMMETIMAPFSAPQLASVYGLTGKVQLPSEAINIENPVGAFAANAILDPTNLVGAGIAKNLGKGSLQNMFRSRMQRTRPNLQRILADVPNELPAPPSELRLNENTGQFDAIYDTERPYFDQWMRMYATSNPENISDLFANPPIHVANSIDLRKLKKVKNKSGLTREDILKNISFKDKDELNKMSELEFENTVLKPTGEIVKYKPENNTIQNMNWNPNVRQLQLKDSIPLSYDEYADIFNSRLDLLNDIIAKNNRSGLEYTVKGLSPSGVLTFNTPSQIEKFLPDTKALNVLRNRGLIDSKGNMSPDTEAFINRWGINGNRNISEGQSNWMIDINPGQWRGQVEDIPYAEYYKAIPGLNMRNTTASVFSDAMPRRGTKAYESINEYLKLMDLGRVKPGFNSQSQFSSGLWEDAIKKGKAFGYFNNPTTLHGSMRTIAPLAVGTAAASQLQENKYGGENAWLNKYK